MRLLSMCLRSKKPHGENPRNERDAPIDGIDHGEINESDELLFVPAAAYVYIPLADN